ncbi:hypothetical protein GSI_07539 [Ganoderma sinense ZZ0214-1]|uniref:Uncharacterized protein n=1 Tax=Ganoderma sinense ZZ0214-1 TaxID=1077348 RepID=A0A2G8S9B2_9APHY|nr:hypothetical protein GSI_07539 [Ganoderma sinense ZZ0214-1]
MSPMSGAGANLSQLDGLELGLVFADLHETGKLGNNDAVAALVAAFEESMCTLAGRVVSVANGNLATCVGPHAAEVTIARFGDLAIRNTQQLFQGKC